jgi:hypothetical protein
MARSLATGPSVLGMLSVISDVRIVCMSACWRNEGVGDVRDRGYDGFSSKVSNNDSAFLVLVKSSAWWGQ